MSSILEQPITAIMKKDAPTVKKGDTIFRAIELMQKTGIHFISVVDGFKTLIGTLSARDILKAFQVPSVLGGTIKLSEEFFSSGLKRTVDEVMTEPPISLEEDRTVADAVRIFTNNQINFIPVVNKGNVIVGLVSLVDIFGHASR